MPWCLGDPLAGVVRVYPRRSCVKALIRDVGARIVAHILVGFKGWVNCDVKAREKVARLSSPLVKKGSWAEPECR